MLKKQPVGFFLITLVVTGAFLSPFLLAQKANAQESAFPLKEKQARNILDIARKEPLSIAQVYAFFASIDSDPYLYSRETGAIVLVKQAILSNELDFWFKKAPLKYSKNFLRALGKLLPALSGNFGGVISIIEKYTVDKANEYIIDKLNQNEIKMAAGELTYVVSTFKGNTALFKTSYLILFNPLANDVVIEFYSAEPIEPPLGTDPNGLAGTQDNPNVNCWPWDRWYEGEKLKDNDNKIEPFIIRVSGKVIQNKDNFTWVDKNKVKVEVEFDQPVPQIDKNDFTLKEESEVTNSFIKDKILNPISPKLGEAFDKVMKVKNEVEKTVGEVSSIYNALKTIFDFGTANAPQALISSQLATNPAPSQPTNPQVKTETTSPPLKEKEALILKDTPSDHEATVVIDNKEYEMFPFVADYDTLENEDVPLKEKENVEPKKTEPIKPGQVPVVAKEPIKEVVFCKISSQTNNQRANQNKVVFNEIAWMGSKESSSDEWLELKNIGTISVSLTGWQVINQKEKIQIALEGTLKPGQLLLLERTNDDSAKGATADLIYTGAISNTEEILFLFAPNCVLEDKIMANPYWPAGDNSLKKTLERKADLTWQTSKDIAGTPKQANSAGTPVVVGGGIGGGNGGTATNNQEPITNNQTTTTVTTTATTTATTTPTTPQEEGGEEEATTSPTETLTPCAEILITEVQIRSTLAVNDDFIELFNPNEKECSLEGFKLKKKSSSGAEYSVKVLSNATIESKGYFLWANSSWQDPFGILPDTTSSQTLAIKNTVLILTDQDQLLNQVSWEEIELGTTFSRKYNIESQSYHNTNAPENDFELGNPTPKAQNQPFTGAISGENSANRASFLALTTGSSAQADVLDLFFIPTSSLKYILKISQTPITEEAEEAGEISFTEAESIEIDPTFLEGKEVVKLVLEGLLPDTLYYFALKFIDLNGATSSISNLAVGKIVDYTLKDQGNETFFDPKTGLTLFLNPPVASSTQFEALNFVESSNNASSSLFNNSLWRLANVKELASFLNYSEDGFSLRSGLAGLKQTNYWTDEQQLVYQSGYPGDPSRYYGQTVNFETGLFERVYYDGGDSPRYPFLMVQGPKMAGFDPEAEIPLTDNMDGTCTDQNQKIMWANAQFALKWDSERKNWQQALRFALNRVLCNDGTFQGNTYEESNCQENGGVKYDDWRLPNLHEFLNISKKGESLAILWLSGFSFFYWTSTEAPNNNAWAVGDGYQTGMIISEAKTRLFNVQLVRDIID